MGRVRKFTKQKTNPNKNLVMLRKQYIGIAMPIASFANHHEGDIDHIFFMMKRERYTQTFFKNKIEAKEADQRKRSELNTPLPTDMAFLTLVNKRLDEVKVRLSHEHYGYGLS